MKQAYVHVCTVIHTAFQEMLSRWKKPFMFQHSLLTMREHTLCHYLVDFRVTRTKWWFFHLISLRFLFIQSIKQACESSNRSAIGKSKFYDIWQHQLPHISICTPSTDLCYTCQQNSLSIQKSFCLSEEEKATRLATAQEHLLHAKTERNHNNSQVDTAQKAWTLSRTNGQPPRITHYSYDFAQGYTKMYIPMIPNRQDRSTSRQLGSVAFLEFVMMEVTNKCSIWSMKPKIPAKELIVL